MPELTPQQRLAVESTDDHIFVSAGAGCGKTKVLVERYLEVLKNHPEAGVHNIIAVTFTRKAAEEMRSRIKDSLRKLCQSDAVHRARWQQLLSDVDRARIATIHSLCESLLRTYPAEAHVDPQFEVLDDLTKAQMLDACLDAALNDLFADADAAANASLLLQYPAEKLKEWVSAQLTSAPQYREARGLSGKSVDDMKVAAAGIIAKAQHQLLHGICRQARFRQAYDYLVGNPFEPGSALEEKRLLAVSCLAEFFAASKNDDWAGMDAALRRIAETPKAGVVGGPKGKQLRQALSQARSFADDFAHSCPMQLMPEDDQAFLLLDSLVRLIDDAMQRYGAAKRQSQKLDYNDMIVKAHELLHRQDSPARRLISSSLAAVLVDEFQDTNRIQSELLCALCGNNTRLFLIGDDKQSIYKFQGADVSNFNEWKRMIAGQSHGLDGAARLINLDISFRSHPSVVEFVNRFFQLHFSSSAAAAGVAHSAAFQALQPDRQDDLSPGHVALVLYDALDPQTQMPDSARARDVESRAIAAWIMENVGDQTLIKDKDTGALRPLQFGDIAILVQSNNDFAAIEPALAAADIPFVTFAGGGFLKRQEIIDIQNMLRFLANPVNDHALLAVLRSPFFSINDGLLHIVHGSEPGSLWQRLQAASGKPTFETLKRPVGILNQLLHDSHRIRVSDLIRSSIVLTEMHVSLLAVAGGKQKSRNVVKMVDFARQYDHLSLTAFVNALESLRNMDAGKQSDAPLAAENSVKLMTIHKSKGLEFAVVMLPVLGRKVHMQPAKLLVHREYGISLDTSRTQDEPKPAFFRAAQIIDNEMDAQEKKRLFYVAMTRARDRLVMFVQQNAANHESFRSWLGAAVNMFGQEGQAISSLQSDRHYTTRFVDEDSLAQWEADGRAKMTSVMSDDQLEALAANTDFSLSAALALPAAQAAHSSTWRSLERATARSDDQPHATLIGELFHAAMQQRIHGLPVTDAQLGALIGSTEISIVDSHLAAKLARACRRLLELYEDSDLAQMLQTSRRIFSETDYTIFAGTVAQEKRPDLIVEDDNGKWHVIDFKSDKVADGDLPAKLNEHAPQVMEYVRDFAALTAQAARGWIYFAELSRLEEVKGNAYGVSKGGQLQLPLLQE